MIVERLATLLAPWQSAYSESKLWPIAVVSIHLAALLLGGGLAVAADRTTLRVTRVVPDARSFHLDELHAVHRPVLIAILVLFVSGVAMAAADVETFVASPYFWIKLACVTFLMGNGAYLAWTESRVRALNAGGQPAALTGPLWKRLRFTSRLSIFLWTATLIAGVVLTNAA